MYKSPQVPNDATAHEQHPAGETTIQTSASLLARLSDPEDRTSWQKFYDTYASLLHRVALRAGLGEAAAQDVVQETLIDVAQQIRDFRYDRARGSFKGWLLTILRRRIADQARRRVYHRDGEAIAREERLGTALAENLTEPDAAVETLWNEEWHRHAFDLALQRVRAASQPLHFQVFQLAVLKELSAAEVSERLGVGTVKIYWIKNRLTARLKKALADIEEGTP